VTDGVTQGSDDKTTAIVMPPQTPAVDIDLSPQVMLLGSGELGRELAIALGRLGARMLLRTPWPTNRSWSR
jgi:phosphoribosylglycinamide formyltransferase 2